MTNKPSLTDEQKAEAIAKFLGMEIRADCVVGLTNQKIEIPITYWLASDAGTVAMILCLKHNDKFQTMAGALLEDDINAALQAAILEVIEHG